MKEFKHWKCWKCGAITKHKGFPGVCVMPFALRTSGICRGSFEPITKKEYKETLKKIEDGTQRKTDLRRRRRNSL